MGVVRECGVGIGSWRNTRVSEVECTRWKAVSRTAELGLPNPGTGALRTLQELVWIFRPTFTSPMTQHHKARLHDEVDVNRRAYISH